MDKKSGNLLTSGEKILDLNENEHVVRNFIAGGGQGEIYSTKDPSIALKINKKNDNNELFETLLRLPIPKNINITFSLLSFLICIFYNFRRYSLYHHLFLNLSKQPLCS